MRISFLILLLHCGFISLGQFDDKLKLNIQIEDSLVSSLQELEVAIVLINSSDHKTHFYSNLVNDPSVLFFITDSVLNKIELTYVRQSKSLDKLITIDPQKRIERAYSFKSCTSKLQAGEYILTSGFFKNSGSRFYIK